MKILILSSCCLTDFDYRYTPVFVVKYLKASCLASRTVTALLHRARDVLEISGL
jgi:hypothetical protein